MFMGDDVGMMSLEFWKAHVEGSNLLNPPSALSRGSVWKKRTPAKMVENLSVKNLGPMENFWISGTKQVDLPNGLNLVPRKHWIDFGEIVQGFYPQIPCFPVGFPSISQNHRCSFWQLMDPFFAKGHLMLKHRRNGNTNHTQHVGSWGLFGYRDKMGRGPRA